MKTDDGNSWSPSQQMGGRPIGFDIRMGKGLGWGFDYGFDVFAGDYILQPVALRIVYNTCNCPVSSFIGAQSPSDMAITIGGNTLATQSLNY